MTRIINHWSDPDTMAARNARWRAEWAFKYHSNTHCRDPRHPGDAARQEQSLRAKRIAAREWLAAERRRRRSAKPMVPIAGFLDYRPVLNVVRLVRPPILRRIK